MTGPAPMCFFCVHLRDYPDDALTCDAFPTKIPDEIIDNLFDHRGQMIGQTNDVVFEQDPEQPKFDDSVLQ